MIAKKSFGLMAIACLCGTLGVAAGFGLKDWMTPRSTTTISQSAPVFATNSAPSVATVPVPNGAPLVAVDYIRAPLQAPMDPEAAATALKIPDNVPPDQLWDVGSEYFKLRRMPEAAGFFWKGASAGDAHAASALGSMYVNGEGVHQDLPKGIFWLTKAAGENNRGAQYMLGVLYERGTGVQENSAQAITYFTSSAQQGFAPADKALALDYEFGRGVTRDRQQAIYWMQQAANNGDGEAPVLVVILANPQAPAFQNEQQLVLYAKQHNFAPGATAAAPATTTTNTTNRPVQQRPAATANAQRRPPTAQEIREAQAVTRLMKQSMGFGGIFGGALNNSIGPSTWGKGGGNPCEYYPDPAACNAHKNGDDWAAERLQNNRSTGSERDWYNR